MYIWICAALVLLPLAAAPVGALIGIRHVRARDNFIAVVTAVQLLLAAALLSSGQSGTLPLARLCGLGLELQFGGLRSLLALLAAAGWLSGTLMLREYFRGSPHQNRYYAFWLLTLGATTGVFLSGDLMTTFVFFEMMSLTSYVMVVHTQRPDAVRAGDTYLAVAVVCGLVTLSGLMLLYQLTGTLNIDGLYDAVQAVERGPALWVAGGLTVVGFAAKAGVFPLHIWLPTAHPAAPAPASGVLSGVILKAGVFGILVVSTQLFRFQTLWGNLLLVLGLITMVLGAVLALFSVDLKRILACSSVSQIGFILVGIAMQCLLGEHGVLAAEGTMLHLVNHASIKLILFPAAGVIYCSLHSFDLNRIRGFGRDKPWLMAIVLIPVLSLAGVPGFSGYVSKTLLHESMVEYIHLLDGSPLLTAVYTGAEWIFLFTGGLTCAYLLKLFTAVFLEPPPRGRQPGHKVYMSRTSGLTLSCCALAILPLGLLPHKLMEPLAALAIPFVTDAPMHGMDYFTPANLRGAIISMVIGLLVYLYVVRRFLIREEEEGSRYLNRWPRGLNLENRVYRPLLLKALPFLGAVPARLAETLVDGTLSLISRALYHRQTSTVEPDVDPEFAAFSSKPRPRQGFRYSFAYSLMLMGLGIAFCMLYLILR